MEIFQSSWKDLSNKLIESILLDLSELASSGVAIKTVLIIATPDEANLLLLEIHSISMNYIISSKQIFCALLMCDYFRETKPFSMIFALRVSKG